jgi:hypothetical protein
MKMKMMMTNDQNNNLFTFLSFYLLHIIIFINLILLFIHYYLQIILSKNR